MHFPLFQGLQPRLGLGYEHQERSYLLATGEIKAKNKFLSEFLSINCSQGKKCGIECSWKVLQ